MKVKQNPSLVPLNVAYIDKVAGQLAAQVLESDSLIAERTVQVRREDGKQHKVWINVLSRSWIKGRIPGTLFAMLARHHDPSDDPEAWDKTRTVTITLNADLILRYLGTDPAKAKDLLRRDLRLVLLHELTHSSEPKLRGARYSRTEPTFKSYYRDPQEVRARTREVVDSILHGNVKARIRDYREASAGGYTGTLVEFLADTTEQWRHMHPFLEPAAEKRALQMIERALRDKKIDTSGKGALLNPRPIPLDAGQVDALVQDLFRQIVERARESEAFTRPFDQAAYGKYRPVSDAYPVAESSLDLPLPSGSVRRIQVRIFPWENPNKGDYKYLTGGEFIRARGEVNLKLRSRLSQKTFGASPLPVQHAPSRELKKELRDVLVHELTHAAEPIPRAGTYHLPWKKRKRDPKEAHEEHTTLHTNDPQEVRADAQMMLDEILRTTNLKGHVNKYRKMSPKERTLGPVEWMLKKSPRWKLISGYMTDDTRRRTFLMIERGLRDADIDTSGKGVLPNPSPKTKPSQTVKIARVDGSTEEVPVVEQFGDLAVVERIERRKHHGYSVVHIPTQRLFRRHLRTKPEAVAQARFYGSVPEGMDLLRRLAAEDPEAQQEVTSGDAFNAWQQGRTRTKPVEYKAHYWFRVRKQDPNQPRGSTLEENVRLDTFEDALALMIGTEIKLNETTGWARLMITRRTGTKEVDVLWHYRDHNDPPWSWMIRGSNEPELLTLPMEALQPPRDPNWKPGPSVSQLPEGFDGFDESVFKNPKGRAVTPESGVNLLNKLYYDRAPIPTAVLMSAIDDFRSTTQATEDVVQSPRMAKEFREWPAQTQWFHEAIARLEQHPVLGYLNDRQKKTFLGAVQVMKESFTNTVSSANPAARRGVPEKILASGKKVDVYKYPSARDAEQEYYGDLSDLTWVFASVPVKHFGCSLIEPVNEQEEEFESGRFERLYEMLSPDPVKALKKNPIIALSDGTVLDGCHRINAWKDLKLTKTPIPAIVGIVKANPNKRSAQDDGDIQFYMTGGCGVFAIALHRVFGYPMGSMLDDENEDFTDADGEPVPGVVHVFGHQGDKVIDAKGIRTIQDVKNDFYDVKGRVDWKVGEREVIDEYSGDDKPLYEITEKDIDEAKAFIVKHRGRYEIGNHASPRAKKNPGEEILPAMAALSLASPFEEMAVGALVGAAIGSVAGSTSTEAMSAPTFAWRAYVSRLEPNKEPISEYVRNAKEGTKDPRMARYVASGLATLVRRRPEFDKVDAVVLMPRRGPGMENDLAAVGKILASELGVRFIPDYLVRTRIPLGGQEVMRRTRYPASEHTATMQVPVTRGVKKPLVLDNVLATGATLNGAYEAIRRDAKADPVGLVILWSPDFWQAPENDRMRRRKNP